MLEDVTAIVTGASGGIGRRIATEFADAGARVAVAARSDGIHEVSTEIGDAAIAVRTDVTDPASVESCIDEVVNSFGGIDCIVNNAAVAGPTAPVDERPIDEWRTVFEVNVYGPVRVVVAALPSLRSSPRASVVNLSSKVATRPAANRSAYVASKSALVGVTRALAVELGDDDITVNAISPGAVEGDRLDSVIEAQASSRGWTTREAKERLFLDGTALGELATPGDVAALAAFLAGDRARHITGQDIDVSAGAVFD